MAEDGFELLINDPANGRLTLKGGIRITLG
jgi:hypothetical protein